MYRFFHNSFALNPTFSSAFLYFFWGGHTTEESIAVQGLVKSPALLLHVRSIRTCIYVHKNITWPVFERRNKLRNTISSLRTSVISRQYSSAATPNAILTPTMT